MPWAASCMDNLWENVKFPEEGRTKYHNEFYDVPLNLLCQLSYFRSIRLPVSHSDASSSVRYSLSDGTKNIHRPGIFSRKSSINLLYTMSGQNISDNR